MEFAVSTHIWLQVRRALEVRVWSSGQESDGGWGGGVWGSSMRREHGKESALCPQDLDMTQGGGEVPFSIPEPG